MPKFYMTMGTNLSCPFNAGWIEITAPNRNAAIAAFHAVHTCTNSHSYAFCYPEADFMRRDMYKDGNNGQHAREYIGLVVGQPSTWPISDCRARDIIVKHVQTLINNMDNYPMCSGIEGLRAIETSVDKLKTTMLKQYDKDDTKDDNEDRRDDTVNDIIQFLKAAYPEAAAAVADKFLT